MGKRILTVLRSGGDFFPRHVQALKRQVERWAPDAQFACLSDVAVEGVECIPLLHHWPDWWSKMELFRPDIRGDFLCTDLDNVFLGPLTDVLSVDKYTTQRGESNALAYYPEAMRAAIWEAWVRDPAEHMRRFHPLTAVNPRSFGDAGFIASLTHAEQYWEDLLPGQLVNLSELGATRKSPGPPWPFRPKDIPPDTRVLLCWRPHRPWLLPALRRLHLYD